MRLTALTLICGALLGACASSSPAPGVAAAEKEKKVCKSETVLGRMSPVQVCQTQAEWDELKDRQARGVKDADRRIRSDAGTFKSSAPDK